VIGGEWTEPPNVDQANDGALVAGDGETQTSSA
jgi:hypothetical protein